MVKIPIKYLIWSCVIFALEWAYLPFYLTQSEKELSVVHKMYPFDSQLITYQTYTDYLARHIEILIPVWLLSIPDSNRKQTLIVFKWLLFGYLADYILTYNQPIGWFYFLPLSYGFYMCIAMISLTIREVYRHGTIIRG